MQTYSQINLSGRIENRFVLPQQSFGWAIIMIEGQNNVKFHPRNFNEDFIQLRGSHFRQLATFLLHQVLMNNFIELMFFLLRKEVWNFSSKIEREINKVESLYNSLQSKNQIRIIMLYIFCLHYFEFPALLTGHSQQRKSAGNSKQCKQKINNIIFLTYSLLQTC